MCIAYTLHDENNTPIKTYGIIELTLNLNLPKQYTLNFIIADVGTPIIRADLLKAPVTRPSKKSFN